MIAQAKTTSADLSKFSLRGPVADFYQTLSEERWDEFPHEQLIWGAAGTAKSFGVLAAITLFLMDPKRGGVRVLWARKTRRSITQSSLVTLQKVWRALGIPWPVKPAVKDMQELKFRTEAGENVLVFCGLDNPGNAFSSEFDIVIFEELQQIGQAAYELTAVRALRNYAISNQFIVSLTNPTGKTGWIYRRAWLEKRMSPIRTVLEDNPFFAHPDGTLTTEGVSYRRGMAGSYTGARKLRMLAGEWVGEEGACIDNYDRDIHGFEGLVIIDPYRAPRIVITAPHPVLGDSVTLSWTFASMDFGWVNAAVLLVWGVDTTGRMYLLDEVYHTMRDRSWWTERVIEMADKYQCRCFVTDHDPERLAFWNDEIRRRLPVLYKTADGKPYVRRCAKSAGSKDALKVEVVRSAFDAGVDGAPMCYLNLNSRRHAPDPELLDASKPTSIHEEIPELVWKELDEALVDDRMPEEKLHPRCANHAFDAMVYACRFLRTGSLNKDWSKGHVVHPPGSLEAHIEFQEKKWKSQQTG